VVSGKEISFGSSLYSEVVLIRVDSAQPEWVVNPKTNGKIAFIIQTVKPMQKNRSFPVWIGVLTIFPSIGIIFAAVDSIHRYDLYQQGSLSGQKDV
jgi:hypothetical protein